LNILESSLRTGQQMFDATFDSAVIGKAIVAVTGHCIRVNASLAKMLGYPQNALVGMHFAEFTLPADIDADHQLFGAVMRGEREGYQLEKRYVRADGQVLEILLSATCVRDEAGLPLQFVSEVVDLTERNQARRDLQEANARLRKLVVTDHVTGLFNRRGFEETIADLQDGQSLGVLVIDLDNFKTINDRLGHSAGDEVLREVARRLRPQVRDGDVIARIGGDEFGILLTDAGCDLATVVAGRVVRALRGSCEVEGGTARIGASVGVAFSDGQADRGELVRQADAALYAAKRAGRGLWRLAS
jgi:diguanylate cyclase (GGDEF)-like protein/PAS domain S-box-containing protein